MTKEKVRVIQTVLWSMLVLVQMAIVGCLEVRAETVRREVMYEAVEGEAELPEKIPVSVLAGNDEELVYCQTVECEEEAAYWREDFSFPVIFFEYGAAEYQLGEIRVEENGLDELVEEHGEDLLRSMGLSPEEYGVSELSWAGTPYENEEGVLCRAAEGHGSRLLRDYRVVYEGFVDPERWRELKRGGAVEELDEEVFLEETEAEVTSGKNVNIQIAQTGEETDRKKSKLQEFLEKVTQILLIAVGIGTIFFFGGLFLLALLWLVRKFRRKGTE